MTRKKFDVFLSHNKDKPAVRALGEALKARGLEPWLDEWELIPGHPWQEALEEIIQNTKSAAVLIGKDGFGPWELPEMRACLSEFVDRKMPVIPVLLPGAPDIPKLPLFLRAFTWVDLRGGLTKTGLDRLEWGITGVKPDGADVSFAPPSQEKVALNQSSNPALETWKKKLRFLQEQEAITANPALRFELAEQIEEAKAKITELGG